MTSVCELFFARPGYFVAAGSASPPCWSASIWSIAIGECANHGQSHILYSAWAARVLSEAPCLNTDPCDATACTASTLIHGDGPSLHRAPLISASSWSIVETSETAASSAPTSRPCSWAWNTPSSTPQTSQFKDKVKRSNAREASPAATRWRRSGRLIQSRTRTRPM